MGVGSVLKAGLKALPDDAKVPAQSVPNLLKKQGVKDEELKFSGVKLPTEGKVTKADLQKMESERLDIFNVEEVNQYNWVNLKPGRNNPTYKEKVTTYSEKGATPQRVAITDQQRAALQRNINSEADPQDVVQMAQDLGYPGTEAGGVSEWLEGGVANSSRFTSSHFADVPNYLMHSRIYDDTMDGVPTRVITEIQSDLHQAGRKQGYGGGAGSPEDVAEMQGYQDILDLGMEDAEWDEAARNFDSRSIDLGRDPDTQPDLEAWFEGFKQGGGKGIPESPFEKTWLRKGMEREISDAIDEGRGQVAIPISGAVGDLKRAPGVQKWYETQVASTAKKLAKSSGMDFEMKTVGTDTVTAEERTIVKRWLSNEESAQDREAVEQIATRLGIATDNPRPLMNMLRDAEEGGAVTYAVIKPRVASPGTDVAVRESGTGVAVREAQAGIFISKETQDFAERLGYDGDYNGNDIARWASEHSRDIRAEASRTGNDRAENLAYADKLDELERQADGSYDLPALAPKPGPKLEKPNFALYASPGASALIAYSAIKAGYAQEEVEQQLIGEGYSPEDVQEIMQNTQIVAEAKAAGYTDEQIKEELEKGEVQIEGNSSTPTSELEPPTPNRFTDAYAAIMGADEMGPQELLAKMEITYPDDSFVTTNIAGMFGDQEAKRISDASVAAQRERITQGAAARGLNIRFDEESGEWLAQVEGGEAVVTPEWYRSFWEAKGEFVLGFTGGIAAGTRAMQMAPGGIKGKLLAGAGVVGMTAIAAIAGTELDYMHSAMVLQQDFEGEAMARKAFTSAEFSVIGDAVGLGIIKVGGASWHSMKKAKDFIKNGMVGRAATSLKETFFITDESAELLVERLARVADIPTKSSVDQAITAVALTKPGGEELVSASVHSNPRASRAVVKAIDDRAQDLLAETGKLEGEGVGRFLRDELEGYTASVRDNFQRVKAQASAAPKGNNFRFDYDKLALDPVLRDLGENIENPELTYKFLKQAQKIRNMSKSRRLGDLIELRKMVNEFRFNKRISNMKHYDRLDGIKAGIDKAIQQGAYATMENPQRWLSEWKTANRQYSEMKVLQKNVLAKVLERPGVTEKVIGQALAKYAPALDSTFVEVVARLPKKTKVRVEGAVLNNLAEKFTAGAVDGVKATNFPGLAKELEEITFSSPEARKMKKAINELAAVFKNDQPLSNSAGGIQVTQFAQALTTDPVAKAKFAISSHLFHYVRSMAPTASGRASALIVKTAEVLKDPINAKSIKELTEMIDGEVNIAPQLEELVKQATLQNASGGGVPKMKLYGDGKVLQMKGAGKEHSIPMQRIARTEEVRRIAEAAGVNMSDKKTLDVILRERGYMAVQLGENKVRVIGD